MSSTFVLNSEIVCLFVLMQDCWFCEGPFLSRSEVKTWESKNPESDVLYSCSFKHHLLMVAHAPSFLWRGGGIVT